MSILSHSESTWKTLVLKHEARILQLVAENSKLTTALEEMTQRGLRQAEHRIVADQRAEVAERETAALREEHETLKERNRALLAEPSEPFLIACLQGDQEALQQAIAALRQERDDWRQASRSSPLPTRQH